ncbi:anaphase-promoting complex subunit Hcn1 [Rhizoclosmatium hyalinum]|nr:anaphase-promoting complex subunit Hcn1 [Rhizoclosmatium hyalinum]
MEQLNDYVKWKNLSTETELKLFSYYETKYRGKFFEEESLLSEMNESLRAEISLQNTRALLERVPFLKRQYGDGRDEIFLGRLAMALRPQYYVTGDYITKQGDSGHDMFFILHGKVDVSVNGKKMVSLFDGAYIGEVALITNVPRTATVQAAMPSILYRLNYNDFHDILDEFLDMKMRIEALANEREAASNLVKAATMAHPVESPRSSVGSF